MSSCVVKVENVSKSFGSRVVLKNINFLLREGEVLGILGKSGAGKSVLMHMLRGMEGYEPTQGKVIYNVSLCSKCLWVDLPSNAGLQCPLCESELIFKSVDFWHESEELREAIKKRVGIMFQRTFALYGYLSPIENIMEALRRARYPEKDVLKKALEYAEKVKLLHRLRHPAEILSGGEKQRVILARQLAINPIVLLADEPTGTLDPATTKTICELLISEVKKKNKTMIVASHLPEVVKMLSDRVVWLDKGKIMANGPTEDVMAEFLGTIPQPTFETRTFDEKILRVISVKKYYYSVDRGLVKALDGVSFDVKRQEIFGIIGPSGAGKTTLTRILTGYLEPSEGDVKVKVGNKYVSVKKLYTVGVVRSDYIGLLHQEYSLYPYRTVYENLTDAIGLELPAELGLMKATYVLKGLGFGDDEVKEVLKKYPDELSEGERHRVMLSQVLIREPRIVILDEPSGTMDPLTKVEVARSIRNARNELEETFIIVSHDMDFASLVCDSGIFIQDGKVVKTCEKSFKDFIHQLQEYPLDAMS